VARFASAALVATTLIALGTGVWAWRGRRTPAPEVRTNPALAAREVPHTPRAPVAEPVAIAPAPAPALAENRAPTPRRERSHRVAPVETEADALSREIALIDAARGGLEAAPAQSLAALDRHRREFLRGQLAAEREFLAVEALRRLGRLDEARRRAGALATQYPSSSYAARALRSLPPP
jgi:hypothetical protein